MRFLLFILFLISIPSLALADSHVNSIGITRENPEPMTPIHIYVEATLPDQCWTQGPVGEAEFMVLDSYDGEPCPGGLFLYGILFEFAGLPEGVHSITITERHDGTRDPGTWEHVVEFTVGTPPVSNEEVSWSSLKALYR